jgi:hypothetical protein
MQTEPAKAEPPKRKRRSFQFSLRTLVIAVAVLAVPCAYVGWQAKIVKERKMAASEFAQHQYGVIIWSSEVAARHAGKWPLLQVSWLRRLLGDDYVLAVDHSRMPDEVLGRIKAAFPEADFVKLYK